MTRQRPLWVPPRPERMQDEVFRAEPYIANDPEKVASALNAAGNIRNEAAVLTTYAMKVLARGTSEWG